VFSWLICESYDSKGNAIVYGYVPENDASVVRSQANESNRVRAANRYLKSIRYGNQIPLLLDVSAQSARPSHVPVPDFSRADWMFELVFDYGEGHYTDAAPDASGRVFATAQLPPRPRESGPPDKIPTRRNGHKDLCLSRSFPILIVPAYCLRE
jgi:hypothetical protein